MKKKHIIFGGFDYAVYWEMNSDAIYHGIDYFVDNNSNLIGTTYMGKPIFAPNKLLEENKEEIIILIGSIFNHLEIEFQLKDMGFLEDVHYKWAISFCGDEKCPRLWHHIDWDDEDRNSENQQCVEQGEYNLTKLEIVSRMIDFEKFDTIIDLGAANGRIKQYIPEKIKYIPVDYMKYSDETIVCDFNNYEFPCVDGEVEKTCILAISILRYAEDWKWMLKQIAENCTTCICEHHDFVRMNREYRRTKFNNNNAVFNHQIILEMQKLGFKMVEAYDYRLRCVIMKFEREKK